MSAQTNGKRAVSAVAERRPAILSEREIAGAALLVMVFFVLSRVTGLAREIVVGARFGTGAELDAYLAAFRVPDLLFQLVAGGALGSAFIPAFTAAWARDDRAGAWLLFSRLLNLITALLVVLAALAAIAAPALVHWVIAPGFAPDEAALTVLLMRTMLIGTVIFGASGLIMGALNALQHFLLPAAAPIFYNLSILLAAWFLTPALGVYGLAVGVVAGALAHLLVQAPALIWLHAEYTPSFRLRDPDVQEVGRLMAPRVLGLFFVQMHFLVNTMLASRLAAGSLSAMNYAWLIMLLPLGIFAQAIATAAFPTFAAQVAAGKLEGMRHTLGQTLRTVFFLTIPAAVGLWMFRVPLVELLLQRGAFDAASTQMVAFALQFYALGLVAHAALEITVRAFYALHDTLTPVLVGMAAMLLNIGLSFWWVGPLGYGGLALANSTATTLEVLLLFGLLSRRMGGIEGRSLLAAVGRSALAAAVMAASLWLAAAQGAVAEETAAWVSALGGIAAAAAVYLLASWLLRSTELQPALALLLRRQRRLSSR